MHPHTVKTIAIILAIFVFIIIGVIGVKTDILKTKPGGPYSFHKFQIWIWSLVICPCFCIFWGVCLRPEINETSLILLGIASGTLLGAEMINISLANGPGAARLKGTLPGSGIFFKDILLSDENELSLGRLQQLVFTIIYVVIYLSMFFPKADSYPDFDSTAYTLMGISSGTFLIAKGLRK